MPESFGFLRPADFLETALQRGVVVAAVVFVLAFERRDGRDLVGHLGSGDEIAAAELDPVDAEILRHDVEQPLAEEIGLEPARAAIGADRRLVGQLQRHIDVDVGNAIGPGHELRDVARADRAVGPHIGADIGIGVAAQAQDGAVAAAGDLDVAFRLARVLHRHQVLAAVLRPFHRPPGMPRGERNQKVLRIELAAGAEAAADIVLHELDLAFGSPSFLASMRRLKNSTLAPPQTVSLPRALVPFRQQAARLHGKRHMPLDAQALAPDVGRIRKAAAASPRTARNLIGGLLPCSSNSSVSFAAETRRSATAGSCSMSTSISAQRILGQCSVSASTTAIASPT